MEKGNWGDLEKEVTGSWGDLEQELGGSSGKSSADLRKEYEAMPDRDLTTMASDFAGRATKAVMSIPGSITGLVAPSSQLAKDFKDANEIIDKTWLSSQAQALDKANQAGMKEASAKGELGVSEWLGQMAKNPTELLGSEVVGQGGPLIGLGKVLATKSTALALGVMGTINSASSMGEVRQTFYQNVQKASDEDLQATTPLYASLRKQMDETSAKKILGEQIDGKLVGGMAAAGVISWLAGRTGAEKAIAGGAGTGVSGLIKTTGKEVVGGMAEGGTTSIGGNLATQSVDPFQDLLEGAALGATQEATVGVAMSAGGHLLSKQDGTQKVVDKKSKEVLDAVDKQVQNKIVDTVVPDAKGEKVMMPSPHDPNVMWEVDKNSTAYRNFMAKATAAETGSTYGVDVGDPDSTDTNFPMANKQPVQVEAVVQPKQDFGFTNIEDDGISTVDVEPVEVTPPLTKSVDVGTAYNYQTFPEGMLPTPTPIQVPRADMTMNEVVQEQTQDMNMGETLDWITTHAKNPQYQWISNRLTGFVRAYEAIGGEFSFKSQNDLLNIPGGKAQGRLIPNQPNPLRDPNEMQPGRMTAVVGQRGRSFETILHEAIHGITSNMIARSQYDPNFALDHPAMNRAVMDMQALFEHVRGKSDIPNLSKTNQRMFDNLHEFMSYGLTNPQSVQHLKNIPYQKSNAFVEFVRKIGDLLGLTQNPNAHAEMLRIFDEISQDPMQAAKTVPVSTVLAKEMINYRRQGFDLLNKTDLESGTEAAANLETDIAGVAMLSKVSGTQKAVSKQSMAEAQQAYNSAWKFENGKVVMNLKDTDPHPEATAAVNQVSATMDKFVAALNNPLWVQQNPKLAEKVRAMQSLTNQVVSRLGKRASTSERMTAMLDLVGNDPAKILRLALTDPEFSGLMAARTKNTTYMKAYLSGVQNLFDLNNIEMGALITKLENAAPVAHALIPVSSDASTIGTPNRTDNRLSGLLGNFQSIGTLDELNIAMADQPGDISRSPMGQLLRPGIRHLSVDTGHPLISFVNYRIDRALSKAKFKMKSVLDTKDKRSMVSAMHKMSVEDKILVSKILQRGDKLSVQVDPYQIPGLTNAQINAINAHYRVDGDVLAEQQAAAKATGNPPIRARHGHTPASFRGTFRALVRDKDGNPIGFIGEDNKYTFAKAEEWVKKNHPDAHVTRLPDRAADNGYKNAVDLREYQKLFADIPDASEAVIEIAKAMDNSIYGMDKRIKEKLGIWGSEGNKPWRDDKDNANAFFENLLSYYDEAYTHHALQSPLKDIHKATTDYAMDAPNAVEEVNQYLRTMVYHEMNDVGAGINKLVDGILKGFGGSLRGTNKAMSPIREWMTTSALGFYNMQYLMAQLVQVVATGGPVASVIKNDLKLGTFDQAKAYRDNLTMMAGLVLGKAGPPLSPDQKAALAYINEETIAGQSHIEHRTAAHAGPAVRIARKIGQQTMNLGEAMTRSPVFISYYNLIRNSPVGRAMPLADVLDTAKNLTQYAMIDYNAWQRPQVYARLGTAGSLIGTFSTYKHGVIGLSKTLAKDGLNGNIGPFVQLVAFMLATAGAIGMPGIEETDELMKWSNENLGTNMPTPKDWLLKNGHPWLTMGPLSGITGLDLHAKYAMNKLVNLSSDIMPSLSMFYDPLSAVGKLAAESVKNGEPRTATVKAAVKAALPASLRNQFDTHFNVKETLSGKGKLLNKEGEVKQLLTQDEVATRKSVQGEILGAKSLTESITSQRYWEASSKIRTNEDRMSSISNTFKKYALDQSLSAALAKELMVDYVAAGGNPDTLIKSAGEYVKDSQLPAIMRGLLKGKATVNKQIAAEAIKK